MNSFVIIGLGKVGSAIGYLLKQAGYSIAAVVDQSQAALHRNTAFTGGKAITDLAALDVEADCYIITTSDDQISHACEILSRKINTGSIVIHMSGAGGLDLLKTAKEKGAMVGSIHPLQTFSDTESAIQNLPGTIYGITVDTPLKEWSEQLVKNIGGVPFFIEESNRALYHAAACVVSNYFVSLMYMAEKIYGILGLESEKARRAFWPLLMGTLHNIEAKGSISSLTGPIARGDMGTLKKHLQAISANAPDLLDAYREMGIVTVEVAYRKGSLSDDEAKNIKSLLSKGV
ncbi:MAG: DUF2520 domain-containing protein [Syntrophaceae bacterium]|nr:DUF2520 domain-containing protein [Syntrophaceae bacterium]